MTLCICFLNCSCNTYCRWLNCCSISFVLLWCSSRLFWHCISAWWTLSCMPSIWVCFSLMTPLSWTICYWSPSIPWLSSFIFVFSSAYLLSNSVSLSWRSFSSCSSTWAWSASFLAIFCSCWPLSCLIFYEFSSVIFLTVSSCFSFNELTVSSLSFFKAEVSA